MRLNQPQTKNEGTIQWFLFNNMFIIGDVLSGLTGCWKHMLGCALVPLADAWTYVPAPGHEFEMIVLSSDYNH